MGNDLNVFSVSKDVYTQEHFLLHIFSHRDKRKECLFLLLQISAVFSPPGLQGESWWKSWHLSQFSPAVLCRQTHRPWTYKQANIFVIRSYLVRCNIATNVLWGRTGSDWFSTDLGRTMPVWVKTSPRPGSTGVHWLACPLQKQLPRTTML